MGKTVALCLYGYYNNKVNPASGDLGFEYIKANILNKLSEDDDIHVFIHSWDLENKEKILERYSNWCKIEPRFETQIDFTKIAEKYELDFVNDTQRLMYSTLSWYYSRSYSLKSAIRYASENNFEYDCIVAARYDLGQRSKHKRGYNVSLIKFDMELDMNKIYSAMWMQTNAGYTDQWFYSNQTNMALLSTMYDRCVNEYFKPKSEYQEALQHNWIDSDMKDQFSNVRFMSEKQKPNRLYKYKLDYMYNAHLAHKWHFIQTGLYEKSEFLGDRKDG